MKAPASRERWAGLRKYCTFSDKTRIRVNGHETLEDLTLSCEERRNASSILKMPDHQVWVRTCAHMHSFKRGGRFRRSKIGLKLFFFKIVSTLFNGNLASSIPCVPTVQACPQRWRTETY